jgi:hypothetical protein
MAQKVWNVSDDPSTDVAARTIMVFGKSVPPGRFVWAEDSRLARAHKIKKDIENGLLYVGALPPKSYLDSKGRKKHLSLPKGHKRAHGPDVKAKPAKPAPPPAMKKKSKGEAKAEAKEPWKG